MPVGKMRQRLEIQSITRSSDGGGAATLTWSTTATVFGYIEPYGGNKTVFGDQIEGPITHRIHLRYRSDVTFKNRILYSAQRNGVQLNRYFNIKRVINSDTLYKYLELLCEEGVAT